MRAERQLVDIFRTPCPMTLRNSTCFIVVLYKYLIAYSLAVLCFCLFDSILYVQKLLPKSLQFFSIGYHLVNPSFLLFKAIQLLHIGLDLCVFARWGLSSSGIASAFMYDLWEELALLVAFGGNRRGLNLSLPTCGSCLCSIHLGW